MAIYTKNATCAPIRAEEGVTGILTPPKTSTSFRDLPQDQQIGGYPRPGQLSGAVDEALLDSEGRCVILEFPAFVLFGVYSPANRDESRDEFRTSFFEALDIRIRNLVAEGKQVIVTGDLNVVRSPMDSSNVAEVLKREDMDVKEWISTPTRRVFNQLIFEGTVVGERDEGREKPVLWDLCRCFHPDRMGMHTCWDTKKNTRPANLGGRIDYILCSDGLKDWFTHADIQEGLMGSDHCPVYATICDTVSRNDESISLTQLMNPPAMFRDGNRIRQWEQKDVLPISAKLIPEFDRRRNIRDMFTRKATPTLTPVPSATTQASPMSSFTEPAAAGSSEAANMGGPSEPLPNIDALPRENARDETMQAHETPKPNPGKRFAGGSQPPKPPAAKRAKSSAEANGNGKAIPAGPGQRTLQGFFKPKVQAVATTTPSSTDPSRSGNEATKIKTKTTDTPDGLLNRNTETLKETNRGAAQASPPPPASAASATSLQHTPPRRMPSPDRVFDPIEAKESWSKLLGKRVVPRCEHDEPCISLVTKKAGVNCGKCTCLSRAPASSLIPAF